MFGGELRQRVFAKLTAKLTFFPQVDFDFPAKVRMFGGELLAGIMGWLS